MQGVRKLPAFFGFRQRILFYVKILHNGDYFQVNIVLKNVIKFLVSTVFMLF